MHRMQSEGVECSVGVGGLNVSMHTKKKFKFATFTIFCAKALDISWKLDIQ